MSGTWFTRRRRKMLAAFDRGAAFGATVMEREDDTAIVAEIVADARDRFERLLDELDDPGLAWAGGRWSS